MPDRREIRGRAMPSWLVGLLATAAFALLAIGWAIALPINGTYDENQHIVRAYAVVTGQWLPRADAAQALDAAGLPAQTFEAPASLLPGNAACTWKSRPPQPASCQEPVTDRTIRPTPSQAARYSPVYYLLVGVPLRFSPDQTGVLVARLLSAVLSAALLGTAAAIAAQIGNRLLIAALVLAGTPTVMNLAGAINPNGLEITAGTLLFVALLALGRGHEVGRAPATVLPATAGAPATVLSATAAGIAAVLVLTVRQQSGLVLFAGIVGMCLLVARRSRLVALAGDPRLSLGLGFAVLSGAGFAGWWLAVSNVTDVDPMPGRGLPYGPLEVLTRLPGTRLGFYVEQVVGVFSYGETGVSKAMILAWYALVALLVVPALRFGEARLRLAVGGILAACLIMLVEREVHFVPTHGWYSHSRYVMALGVGVLLIAACSEGLDQWLRSRGWLGPFVWLLAAATVPFDLYALVRVMTRFQVGIAFSFDPLGGSWHPAWGSLTALLVALLGATGVALMAAVPLPRATEGPGERLVSAERRARWPFS
ncbi:MAG: DUF2142 domain-containing protein [Micromonosporaceae bacterium]|nr:DUF2142 domain-containing protein [Micromonosporaceae bacterium]